MLQDLRQELRQSAIELGFAELKGPVKDRLRRYGLGGEPFSLTLGVAVKEYLGRTGPEWRDSEDEPEVVQGP